MYDIIEQSWEELGYKIRPMRQRVFVRTEPIPPMTAGGIIIPDKYRGLYEGPFHLRLVNAVVLSVGAGVRGVEVGERICFQRKWFVRHLEVMRDEAAFGWVKESEIAGALDPEIQVDRRVTIPTGANPAHPNPI